MGFQCQASPLLVFLPKLLVKESSIFVPKFRAVSKDDQSARAVKPGPWCPWCQVGEDQPRTSGLRPCIHGRAHPEPLFGFLWQFPVVLLAKGSWKTQTSARDVDSIGAWTSEWEMATRSSWERSVFHPSKPSDGQP